jgi:hypothetical protein
MKEIAGQLNISPHTVKPHLRSTFYVPESARARNSRGGSPVLMPRQRLAPKEIQVAPLISGRVDHREIERPSAPAIGTSEQVIKQPLAQQV